MDTRAYIESGILDAYILGALTKEERIQVEANVAMYPELRTELLEIENAMQAFTATLAKELPVGFDNKIWAALQYASPNAGGTQTTPKVIPFTPDYRKPVRWQYAAVGALLIGSLALNAILWNKSNNEKEKQVSLDYRIDHLQSDQKQLTAVLDEYQKNKLMMADTGMQTIVMHTVQPGHPMAATLYWSKNKGEAYVSVDGLPAPPKGMQYQLWVMQDGKPVDMGVISNTMPSTPAMQKVAMSVTSGQAFAISLEKEGGSPTPTMQNIYVMGKV